MENFSRLPLLALADLAPDARVWVQDPDFPGASGSSLLVQGTNGLFGATVTITQTHSTADATFSAITYAASDTLGAMTAYAAVTTMTDPVTKAEGETFSAAMAAQSVELVAWRVDILSIQTQLAALAADEADTRALLNTVIDALQLTPILA